MDNVFFFTPVIGSGFCIPVTGNSVIALIDKKWTHNLEWSNQSEAEDFCSFALDTRKHVALVAFASHLVPKKRGRVERGKKTVFGDIVA